MPWWNNALYDTCSLITLDKMLLDYPEMEQHFQGILTLEASFWTDQLRRDTAGAYTATRDISGGVGCVRPRQSPDCNPSVKGAGAGR
jgi:hypothetical protein